MPAFFQGHGSFVKSQSITEIGLRWTLRLIIPILPRRFAEIIMVKDAKEEDVGGPIRIAGGEGRFSTSIFRGHLSLRNSY